MKFHYYPETDSLYIDLSEKTGVDSREVAPGVVLDFDAEGYLVGIDIDHYNETLIKSYLLGQVSREVVLKELGPELLEEIDYQRDAIQRDVTWGLKNA